MTRHTLVLKELWRRKAELITHAAAVTLAIAVLVAVHTITRSSKDALRTQMHQLGANVLVVPKSVEVGDYYLADLNGEQMPEENAHRLNASEISEHVHNMMAKLSARVTIGGADVILTGVLPKSELRDRPKWRLRTLFAQPAEESHEHGSPANGGQKGGAGGSAQEAPAPLLTPRLTIESLGMSRLLMGAEAARLTKAGPGDVLSIRGKEFWVEKILDRTGTVDDVRVYAHLHTVQGVLGKHGVINAIEIVGCGCKTDLDRLGKKIEKLLPGARALTIRHVAQTQLGVVRTMQGFALVSLVVVGVLGGGAIANSTAGNVRERGREIGTLLALGARRAFVVGLFVEKAALLGLVGGLAGYLLGTALATTFGPHLCGVPVSASTGIIAWAVALAVALSLAFSALPVWRAMRLDPTELLEED